MRPLHKLFYSLFLILIFFSENVHGQEIEPRVYANVPKGMNAAVTAYTYSTGNVVTDAALPIEDFKISSSTPILGYLRTFSLFKKLSRVQVTIPYAFLIGDLKLNGRDTSGSRSGFTDARVRFGINLFGSPALSPKDFPKYKQKTIFGTSLVMSVPIGQYYPEKRINLGSNRWGFKPEIGVSSNLASFFVEAYTGIWFFTNNNEYLTNKTLSQNPIYSFQFHISYLFKNHMWVAINSAYANGGQTSTNGVSNNDYQNNVRVGVTYSTPISRVVSVKLQFHTGAETKSGGNYKIFVATLQYIWY
jgi:Putative MetA-pathway of phenol degradation